MAGTILSVGGADTPRVRREKGRSLLAFPNDYVSLDIETTGLDPRFNEIIEIAGVRYENDQEAARFQSLVKPGEAIASGYDPCDNCTP